MKEKCIIKDCERPVKSKKFTLCNAHYQQLRIKGKIIDRPAKKYRRIELVIVPPT